MLCCTFGVGLYILNYIIKNLQLWQNKIYQDDHLFKQQAKRV